LCICAVVRRNHSGEKCQVDSEGLVGHALAFPDLFAEVFGCGLGESRELRIVSMCLQ
jgi:hypothetical protein